jgi:serine/threonine protein kinase
MAYLHALHPPLGPIIHGDLKSANLLLQQPGNVLKIGDFGLARLRALTTSSGTAAAAALAAGGACTVGWTAPEVLASYDARLTPASDMYSFGMVLWELTARKLPWGRMTAGEVIDLVKAKGQRPPIPRDCPPSLAELIACCWAQAPEARPASFDGVGRILAALAVHEA